MSRTIPHPYIPGACRVIYDHEPLPRPYGSGAGNLAHPEYGTPGHPSEEARFDDPADEDEPTWDEIRAAEWREECAMRREHS